MEDIYDVLILGGGPAGLTAAIYAGRYNLKTLVIAKSFGGTANLAGEVENWPGFAGSGMDLMKSVKDQAERFGAEFLEMEVSGVEKINDGFVLKYGGDSVAGRSLVVALGTEHRKLGIPGEEEFLGKGVSYCATCDGNFFRGKRVAVIGGADSAVKAALYLADICEKVVIVYRKTALRAEEILVDRIKALEAPGGVSSAQIASADADKVGNIDVIYNAVSTDISGEGVVKSLGILRNGKEERIDVDGVFIEIGANPVKNVVEGLGLDVDGDYIATGKDARTSVEGVFAAGDVTNNGLKQMITAASEGAVAAAGVHEFLQKRA